MAPHPTVLRRLNARHVTIWSGSRLVATVVGVLVAVGLSFALVTLALRRFRREPPAQAMVVEEREAVGSLRSAAGVAAARWRRRLRRRLPRPAPPRAQTPAELVRRRYAELERRLARAGRPRLPGVTVRDHLAAVAAATPATGASDEPVAGGAVSALPAAGGAVSALQAGARHLRCGRRARRRTPHAERALSSLAADLAAIYETARYSAHAVDAAQAGRFEALAQAFRLVAQAGRFEAPAQALMAEPPQPRHGVSLSTVGTLLSGSESLLKA